MLPTFLLIKTGLTLHLILLNLNCKPGFPRSNLFH